MSPLSPHARSRLLHATLVALAVLASMSLHGAVGQTEDAAPLTKRVVLTVIEKQYRILGVPYVAWTWSGTVPGPIIRVSVGTELSIVVNNAHTETHGLHTHLQNYPHSQDASSETLPLPFVPQQEDDPLAILPGQGYLPGGHAPHIPYGLGNPIGPYEPVPDNGNVDPGKTFEYKFRPERPGNYLYHCHVFPIAEHVSRGLYGLIIVYPEGWTWQELEPVAGESNLRAWVTAPDGTTYFEDTVMLSEIDLTGVTDRVGVPTTGETGKVHVANFKAWNAPYFIGPMRTGQLVRLNVANIGHTVHSWHIHGHIFDVLDKIDPAKKVVYTTDTLLMGPGESYETVLTAGNPGIWMVHDHIEANAAAGMIPWLTVTE